MEIQAQHPANKQCFDCELPGPGYLDMTRGCFICQICYMRLVCKKIKKTMSRLYRWMILGINSTLHNPIILKSIAIDTLKWSDVDKLRSRGRCFIQNLFPSKLSIWQVMLGAQRTPQVQWEATWESEDTVLLHLISRFSFVWNCPFYIEYLCLTVWKLLIQKFTPVVQLHAS